MATASATRIETPDAGGSRIAIATITIGIAPAATSTTKVASDASERRRRASTGSAAAKTTPAIGTGGSGSRGTRWIEIEIEIEKLEHRERMRYHDEPARFGMRQQGSSDWREDVDRDRWREGSQMGGRFAGGMGGGGGGGMMVGPDPTGRYWYRGPGQDMVDERYGSAMRDVGRFEGGHHGSQGRMREEHRRYPAGPKGYRRSDDRIRDDLCDTLHQAHDIDSSEVEVKVQSSEVILSGTVPERHMKLRIEQLADRIPGVTDVNNQIRVRRMASQIGPMGREQPIRPQSFGEESEGNGRRTGSPPRA